ncbi:MULTISPECIES: GntR family transcriptional regulator [Ochrobactrum]|uniref:GntR family transcriptional regulator n=1 Tax=Ochrobactrum chromiisoli TaxID=2993941 RepID=A0ABT3QR19_9HYPH|nr:GntR family transcriptional regulator [Ochrobactrum chromiisoli]MCX2698063.1 GntR family transcriptional regulator [Ochrobactrum chromiisoli]
MAYFSPKLVQSRPPKAAVVFEALKRDIMLGTLPAGANLTELEIAAHFQCSQGPVREALLQLQEEGLVLRQGHRGTQVSLCTPDEAVEMFRLRNSIECNGIPRVMMRRSKKLTDDLKEMLEGMLQAADEKDEYRLAAIDRDFHRRIFDEADLPALNPILHRCLVHNHRFKISQSGSARDLRGTALRHCAIIDALEAADIEAAQIAMRHHIATIVDFGPAVFPEEGQSQ